MICSLFKGVFSYYPSGVLKRILSLVVGYNLSVGRVTEGLSVVEGMYIIVKSHYVRLTEPHNAFINFISNNQW